MVYAASVGVRGLLLHPSCGPESLFPLLLPRLCLNRYFVPEGVQVRHFIHPTRSIPLHLYDMDLASPVHQREREKE